ncbi:MAG: YfiT family bacillithiol transferase [Terriglobales bacterium]
MSTDPRYPVGRFENPATYTAAERAQRIATLAAMPGEVRALVAPLSAADLERRYRPEGWTVRQVTHHLADSHLNAYIRMKLGLTQDEPTVLAYDEAVWAKLPDMNMPASVSLQLLEGLHQRWTALLGALAESDFQKQVKHSEYGLMSLDHLLAMYAWHARHHTAHIRQALGRTAASA